MGDHSCYAKIAQVSFKYIYVKEEDNNNINEQRKTARNKFEIARCCVKYSEERDEWETTAAMSKALRSVRKNNILFI